ncbi:hypothetical protein MNBD_GAMMA10-2449 [hydrothermal vent metagenome]|uniref:Uncharacterized protein n=1 Tax=hydrothermal vent metagenome TaxID=652676 RepID=A0A3B0YUH2_9ZZZZ
MQINTAFFNRDAASLARALLGKVIQHRHKCHWLAARIIETDSKQVIPYILN